MFMINPRLRRTMEMLVPRRKPGHKTQQSNNPDGGTCVIHRFLVHGCFGREIE